MRGRGIDLSDVGGYDGEAEREATRLGSTVGGVYTSDRMVEVEKRRNWRTVAGRGGPKGRRKGMTGCMNDIIVASQ